MFTRTSFPRMLASLLAGIGMTMLIGCSQPTPAGGPSGADDAGGSGAVEESGSGSGSSGGAAQPTYTDGVDPSRSSSGDEVYPPPPTEVPVPAGYPDPEEPSADDGSEDAAEDDAAEGDAEGDEESSGEDEG